MIRPALKLPLRRGLRRPWSRRGRMESLETRLLLSTLPAGFVEEGVVGPISAPTSFDFAPDGRTFITLKAGTVRIVENGALLAAPFMTLSVNSSGERGLLGLTFDPDFVNNQYLYVYYTTSTSPIHNRVSRFTANGNVVVPGSELVLMDLETLVATNHNGGAIHFGLDGKLYVAQGENAVSSNSQTLNNRLGKILRINSDGTIPTDNPFFNTATGDNRSIYALGLRNPFTFAVQPGTGRIFVNDVGSSGGSSREEVNDLIAGGNYGWPTVQGIANDPRFIDPLTVYPPTGSGAAISGGAFYNPPLHSFPASFAGDYFFADYQNDFIRVYDVASDTATDFATGVSDGPVDLKVGPDGSLYYLSINTGRLQRIRYPSSVVGRHVFYNNSFYDGNDPAANVLDDASIAPDKTALLPGGTASLANYTSYSRGINGVMVDIANLPDPNLLATADFSFRVGNNNAAASWAAAPAPSSITTRPGAGVGGSDRVTIIWPDGAIKKQWLQVTVLARATTGLVSPSVFYFGNAVGETGNSTSDAVVNAGDEIGARVNSRNPLNPAPIDFRYDFDRDRLVNAADQIIARVNSTNPLTALVLLAAPAESGAGSAAADLALVSEADAVAELSVAGRRRRAAR